MLFQGCWLSDMTDGVRIGFDTFDDTALSESSNWTEAHQNEDSSFPAGYIHPGRIILELGRRMLQNQPELREQVEQLNQETFEIRTAEELGLFCLRINDWLDAMSVMPAKPRPPSSANR